jgi:hypothetical protein
MKIAAIVMFVWAGLSGVVALRNLGAREVAEGADAAHEAGYVVGTVAVPIVLLAIGFLLWRKAKRAEETKREP